MEYKIGLELGYEYLKRKLIFTKHYKFGEKMLSKSVFSDEITVYWDKIGSGNESYEIYFDGELFDKTQKTHCTFSGLHAECAYSIEVKAYLDGDMIGVLSEIIVTPNEKKRIDVTDTPYFAVGDGKTVNTEAIQRAINDADSESYVYLPRGVYLCGALDLHSDTELYIAKGAVLQGTALPEDYLPKIHSRFEGYEMECYRSLINIGKLDRTEGYTTKNVVIRGGGSIFGGGAELAGATIEKERVELERYLAENEEYAKTCENADTIPGRARGRLINISNAENVVICGLSLGFGASWNVHFIYSKNIVTYGCSISSRGVWNGDGWDPDSSEGAVIFDTVFDTHDNAIAIKSGKNPEGNLIGRPTKDVKIFDCRGRNDIAIGSELSGGVEGVRIWDCSFTDSWGINIKTTDKRGGYVRDVDIRDSEFSSITVRTRIDFNNDGEGAGSLTEICGLHLENLELFGVSVNGAGEKSLIAPVFIDGFDDVPVRDVSFKNIRILPREDGEIQHIKCRGVRGLSLEGVSFD